MPQQPNQQYCRNCGGSLSPGASVCAHCGTRDEPKPTTIVVALGPKLPGLSLPGSTLTCSSCGQTIPVAGKICSYCHADKSADIAAHKAKWADRKKALEKLRGSVYETLNSSEYMRCSTCGEKVPIAGVACSFCGADKSEDRAQRLAELAEARERNSAIVTSAFVAVTKVVKMGIVGFAGIGTGLFISLIGGSIGQRIGLEMYLRASQAGEQMARTQYYYESTGHGAGAVIGFVGACVFLYCVRTKLRDWALK
jgi:predicted amidophosphoribosyltransferase